MFNKEVTRKEFLVSVLSVVGLFALNKVSKIIPKETAKKRIGTKKSASKVSNAYGHNTYGGSNA